MSRPRRDPHAERPSAPPGLRLRIERRATGAAASAKPAGGISPVRRIVASPAFLVMVVPDAGNGRLGQHDRELLGAARLLADAGQGGVLLLAPPLDDDAGAAGADRVAGLPEDADPQARAAQVRAAMAAFAPRHVVFAESAEGGDLARRVAAATGLALFAGAEMLTASLATRPSRGRRLEQRAAPAALLSLGPGAASPYAGSAHEARPVPFDPGPATPGPAARRLAADPAAAPLGEAGFVAAAGSGVRDFDCFRAVAKALGAAAGASRAVCDAGLMPRAAQVGASGTVLDAERYLAFGISGAPQHLQGLGRVEHVVAVNTDLHAAMVARAGLAVIADAQAVMRALLDAIGDGG